MNNIATTIPQLKRLIRRAQHGDADAFEELIRPCTDTLYRVAASCLNGRESDIADAIQETLTAAWNNLETLEKPPYFKTWLTRICINACRQITRAQNNTTTLDTISDTLLCDEEADSLPHETIENNDAFTRLVSAAGPTNAAVITLFYGEGYSTAEIAEMLDLSPESVRQRLSRGRKRIAATLEEDQSNKIIPSVNSFSLASPHSIGARAPAPRATRLPKLMHRSDATRSFS